MTEIRSFRTVFDLERRIYRIDRLRLNPTGVPVRGVLYFLALAGLALAASRAPLLGPAIGPVPWYLRTLAAPAGLAALFCLIAIEGRPFHLAAFALLRYAFSTRELAGLRPRRRCDRLLLPGRLLVLADGSDARLRRLRYTGPGFVRIAAAHTRSASRASSPLARARTVVSIGPLSGLRRPVRSRVIELAPAGRLEVFPRQ